MIDTQSLGLWLCEEIQMSTDATILEMWVMEGKMVVRWRRPVCHTALFTIRSDKGEGEGKDEA